MLIPWIIYVSSNFVLTLSLNVLTYFESMLLIKHKMMLFYKVASTWLVGWMTAGGAL